MKPITQHATDVIKLIQSTDESDHCLLLVELILRRSSQ